MLLFAVMVASLAHAQSVYIATSNSAVAYHKSRDCGYLNNAKTVQADAEKEVKDAKADTKKAVTKAKKTVKKSASDAEKEATATKKTVKKTTKKAAKKATEKTVKEAA